MVGLAFLTQSRGMLIGLVCGGIVSFAIGPDRLRRSWLALALVAVIALGSSALLEPYHGSGSGTGVAVAADIREAGVALALLCVASYLAALFAFVFDNGLRSPGVARSLRPLAAAVLLVLVSALAVGGLARIGNPVSYAQDKWDEFTEVETSSASGTRLGTVGGPRYDIYRVAVDQFREHPIAGAGEGSFAFAYYRERDTDRNLADAHSLPLRLLAETGLIGSSLFALWLVAVAVAVAGRARLASPGRRTAIAGLAAAGTVAVVGASASTLGADTSAAAGTVAVARAVADAPAFSVIGGGDTIAAVNMAGVADRIGYVSTAGGAFLEFLEGRALPGVEALTEAA